MIQDKTILVVEDEPDIQELICYHLAKEGFTLRKANSGKEALEHIQRTKPDLVLLDLMLPVLSGIEVLKTIRFTWGLTSLPVIIVSARTDESDIIMGLELGADNYLPKPKSVAPANNERPSEQRQFIRTTAHHRGFFTNRPPAA